MKDPGVIVDRLVVLLRAIPGLVAEMKGDTERIKAYHDQYPERVSLPQAIIEAESPSILVAYTAATGGTFGLSDIWKHTITLYLRSGPDQVGDPPTAYYKLFREIWKGVPTGQPRSLGEITISDDLHEMAPPDFGRVQDENGLDYWQVEMSFIERGDD